MARKPIAFKPPGADYEIRVVGDTPAPLRDFYHALLRLPWWVTFAVISGSFLVLNAVFAVAYLLFGGIANATAGSFADAFFFSVQTMGTIGYGAMFPSSRAANALVVTESIVGLILTALATGLVFAKFSRSTARVVFSRQAVISPINGVPTLTFRIGNERGNQIVDAQIRMALTRTETTTEGTRFYRMLDVKPTRDRILSLSRSWTAFHTIDEHSPLWKQTPKSLAEQEGELSVMVVGTDDITMQVVHSSHRYFNHQILWGARHTDILSESPDGAVILLDLRKFHEVQPTTPTAAFPYPGDPP